MNGRISDAHQDPLFDTMEPTHSPTSDTSGENDRQVNSRQQSTSSLPKSLAMGSEAASVMSTIDPLFAVPFLKLACREATERQLCVQFRNSVQKIASRYHTLRVEGIKEATRQLVDLTITASVEAATATRQLETRRAFGRGAAAQQPNGSVAVVPPYDAIRMETLGHHAGQATRHLTTDKAAHDLYHCYSPTWEMAQHALQGMDYTSAVFNSILIPRLEVRNAMNIGAPVNIQLTTDAAVQWSTLPTTSKLKSNESDSGQKLPTLFLEATDVTYAEQELALRYVQGMCLLIYHQRRSCADGCLLYYATEVFQCMWSHAEALYTTQRRVKESVSSATSAPVSTVTTANPDNLNNGATNSNAMGSASNNGVDANAPPTIPIEAGLVRVVVALIDAVEAACHYNSPCLRRLVQAGGVTAMLNMAYCPFMPTAIRAAVLNTISILLQEVTPLRRFVAAGSRNQTAPCPTAPPGAAATSASLQVGNAGTDDPVLQRLIQNACNDNPAGRDGRPVPFTMDFGSASKFESAVQHWFFGNGLGNVLPAVMELQDLRTAFEARCFTTFLTHHSPSASNGVTPSAMPGSPMTSSMVPQGSPRVAGVSSRVVASPPPPNAQREGELHQKRISRLLSCMDGRDVR